MDPVLAGDTRLRSTLERRGIANETWDNEKCQRKWGIRHTKNETGEPVVSFIRMRTA